MLIKLVFILTLYIRSFSAQMNTTGCSRTILEYGKGYLGNDIRNVDNVKSVYECCAHCEQESNCEVFTYRLESRLCYIKRAAGTKSECNTCISGQMNDCPGIKLGVDASGNDIRSVQNVNSPDECCSHCSQEFPCEAFTYNHDDKFCWLKHTSGSERECSHCTTGFKNSCSYYPMWTSWSECSASCDHGTRFRAQRQVEFTGGVAFCPSDFNNYEHQSCNTHYCSDYSAMAEFTACTSLNGFFTKNNCYFLVDGVTKWTEIFTACQAAVNGGQPGFLFDTNELQSHILAFLLKNSVNASVWWPIKYTQVDPETFDVQWMIEQNKAYLPFWFSTENLNIPAGHSLCLWIQLSELSSRMKPFETNWSDCNTAQPISKALCQTSEKFYADFRTKKNTRIMIEDSSLALPSSVEKNVWFCGLRCRQTDRCIGFNFQESTGSCEPLPVDEELLVDGKVNWGGSDVQIFNRETTASGWNHYPRIY